MSRHFRIMHFDVFSSRSRRFDAPLRAWRPVDLTLPNTGLGLLLLLIINNNNHATTNDNKNTLCYYYSWPNI